MIGSNAPHSPDRNAPWMFWRLLHPGIGVEEWRDASVHAAYLLRELPAARHADDPAELVDMILTERQFGQGHWNLTPAKRAYYMYVRPLLPAWVRPFLRRALLVPQGERSLLRWPVEDRYVRYQFAMLRHLLERIGESSVQYLRLWPHEARYALALTHDIETAKGQEFVREVAALEERYGFRSAFNFVAEDYPLDEKLLGELRERGFEVGLHGLKHDGRLFLSRREFERDAMRINRHLKRLNVVGFRAPFTHRNPEWMQALEIEHDSTFFDTDPFETINGGTMSIWPFMMGHFVELPFTLPQDHTLLSMVGENSPDIWLRKIDFIERHRGMAMTISHPDYLRDRRFFEVYEEFLRQMSGREGYWHALPTEIARWWRMRADAPALDRESLLAALPGASIGTIRLGSADAEMVDESDVLVVAPEEPER